MTTNLADVCLITMGQAPSGDSYNSQGEGLPLIAGAGDFDGLRLSPKKFTSMPGKTSAEGDIILGIRASIGAKVWSDGEYCLGRGVAGLRPKSALDAGYLWHWLTHSKQALVAKGRGATFLQVNRRDIGEMPINLPPLPEQRRIAAILDQADALRAKRRQVLAHLGSLTQSIFDSMFADTEWPLTALGDVALVTSGITKGRKTVEPTRPVPYLAVSNVQAGHLRMEVVKEIEATPTEIKRYALEDGDLVLTEGGDPDKLGRGTVWRSELPLCLHQNHIFRVRPRQGCSVLPDFLAAYMASKRARSYFLRAAKQTTGIASINMTQLKGLPVALPPIAMQTLYLARFDQVNVQRVSAERAIASNERLFASLQSRAFRGEL